MWSCRVSNVSRRMAEEKQDVSTLPRRCDDGPYRSSCACMRKVFHDFLFLFFCCVCHNISSGFCGHAACPCQMCFDEWLKNKRDMSVQVVAQMWPRTLSQLTRVHLQRGRVVTLSFCVLLYSWLFSRGFLVLRFHELFMIAYWANLIATTYYCLKQTELSHDVGQNTVKRFCCRNCGVFPCSKYLCYVTCKSQSPLLFFDHRRAMCVWWPRWPERTTIEAAIEALT